MHLKTLAALCLLLCARPAAAQHPVYALPGQGADARSFQRLVLPPGYELRPIELPVPGCKEPMASYARRVAAEIDTTQPFSLLGVSMGGMAAVEISRFLHPEHLILIASIKHRDEMPPRYRFLRAVPLHRLFGGQALSFLGNRVRNLYEPEGRPYDSLYTAMLRDKPRKFLPRAIGCIAGWESDSYPPGLIHIHGTRDRTLPYRHVRGAIPIERGSHLLIMTRAEEISAILADRLPPR
jgi:pimeloyl-ACP methyl ester carboxylesterase